MRIALVSVAAFLSVSVLGAIAQPASAECVFFPLVSTSPDYPSPGVYFESECYPFATEGPMQATVEYAGTGPQTCQTLPTVFVGGQPVGGSTHCTPPVPISGQTSTPPVFLPDLGVVVCGPTACVWLTTRYPYYVCTNIVGRNWVNIPNGDRLEVSCNLVA